MISAIISRLVILLFGTLYPAYSSYKAVRTKNVKEYVKWMMYWIVYAFFTCIETFTDIFLSWFPFYYEIKVIIVIWLLSPATKGSSTLYRKFVHPMLTRREQEIDEYLNQAKEKGYTAVLQLGSKGVNYATNVIMQTALKGGGNLVQSIRRSYSLSDLSEPDIHRTQDEIDEVTKPQRFLRSTRNQSIRSSSGSRHSAEIYFSEVDVGGNGKSPVPNYNYIRSTEDISSGYSSAEPISGGLSRTSSMTNATRSRFKAKRAEEGIYLTPDEYELAMREFPISPSFYSNNYYPQILFYQNPSSLLSSVSSPSSFTSMTTTTTTSTNSNANVENSRRQSLNVSSSTLNDLKDEIFLENEKFFQNILVQNLENNSVGNGGKNATTMTHKNVEFNNMPISTEDMKEEYEMFRKWLEANDENKQQKELVEHLLVKKQASEDDYKDTISMDESGGEEETFLDTETINEATFQQMQNESVTSEKSFLEDTNNDVSSESENVTHMKENLQTEIPSRKDAFSKVIIKADSVCSSDSDTKTSNNQSTTTTTTELQLQNTLPSLLQSNYFAKDENFKSNPATSDETNNLLEIHQNLNSLLLELSKRPPAHHSKGKAPDPPVAELSSSSIASVASSSSLLPLSNHFDTVPTTSSLSSKITSQNINTTTTTTLATTEANPSKSSIQILSDSTTGRQISHDYYPTATTTTIPDTSLPHSRSPSPSPTKSDAKKMKKSLFKNYLPSLFRSESQKNSNSNPSSSTTPIPSPTPLPPQLEEFHKETQI